MSRLQWFLQWFNCIGGGDGGADGGLIETVVWTIRNHFYNVTNKTATVTTNHDAFIERTFCSRNQRTKTHTHLNQQNQNQNQTPTTAATTMGRSKIVNLKIFELWFIGMAVSGKGIYCATFYCHLRFSSDSLNYRGRERESFSVARERCSHSMTLKLTHFLKVRVQVVCAVSQLLFGNCVWFSMFHLLSNRTTRHLIFTKETLQQTLSQLFVVCKFVAQTHKHKIIKFG